MPESDVTFEKVFRYCYENYPKQDWFFFDELHKIATCVWDYKKNTFVNLDKKLIVLSPSIN